MRNPIELGQLLGDLKCEMKDRINAVLSGKLDNISLSGISLNLAAEYLESLGWTKGELSTNGWQYDWWLDFTKDGRSFTASGGGYYGDFAFGPTEA